MNAGTQPNPMCSSAHASASWASASTGRALKNAMTLAGADAATAMDTIERHARTTAWRGALVSMDGEVEA